MTAVQLLLLLTRMLQRRALAVDILVSVCLSVCLLHRMIERY